MAKKVNYDLQNITQKTENQATEISAHDACWNNIFKVRS
jgi:hypothetical protein